MTDPQAGITFGPEIYDQTGAPKGRGFWRRLRPTGSPGAVRRWLQRAALIVVVLLLIYYPVGALIMHKIDDNLSYTPDIPAAAGGSRAVAMAAGLIAREVDQHGWTANDPIFMPSAILDNMPNFQQGLVAALARFAFELTDQIGRTRGTSTVDPDLQEAAGLLQYSGTKWVFDLSTSLAPTATSEAQYRQARRALLNYNVRLARNEATFERRADNLLATMDRMAADLGSSSAAIERRLREGPAVFDEQADDIFYTVKGQLYAYRMLLQELGVDFERVIRERDLASAWEQMLQTLNQGSQLDPLVILNGSADNQFIPSHLAGQGFYLLRARAQLREITNILLK